MNRKTIIVFILSVSATLLIACVLFFICGKSVAGFVKSYSDMSYAYERGYIENIPVYRDFVKSALVGELQKYDLGVHMKEVVKTGISPMHDEKEIMENVRAGRLVELKSDNELFYFHNVQKQYRYLTPATLEGLRLVAERFQEKVRLHKEGLPPVKIAVSSVIRTVDYQEKIFGRKFVSAHSFGGCFDIFFEDYFVALPEQGPGWWPANKIEPALRTRFGFLMGDSLREQFRTILMETLLELQREGVLYAFLEDDRRCYHITILVK